MSPGGRPLAAWRGGGRHRELRGLAAKAPCSPATIIVQSGSLFLRRQSVSRRAGLVFALIYYAIFTAIDESGWWLGAIFGLVHALFASTALVNLLLPLVHPRMGSPLTGVATTCFDQQRGQTGLGRWCHHPQSWHWCKRSSRASNPR